MRQEEIFIVLGIQPTRDEAAIKMAYRNRLRTANPEDDPEGFKRLRQAYEEACSYARETEKEEEERDTSPSGLWLEKAALLYQDFHARCREENWKVLFEEEVFLSLEENEECRKKLLVFMMDHHYFPFSVWKLLDKHLAIRAEWKKLKEVFPSEYVDYLIRRTGQEESIPYELLTGPADGNYDLFLRDYWEAWNAVEGNRNEEAVRFLAEAEATGIYHPYLELIRARMFMEKEEKNEALNLLCRLAEEYTEDLLILYQTGELLWQEGREEEAVSFFLRIKEQNEDHYMANYRLAFYYARQEQYEKARQCCQQLHPGTYDEPFKAVVKKVNAYFRPSFYERWKDGDEEALLELIKGYMEEESFFSAARILEKERSRLSSPNQQKALRMLISCYLGLAENRKAEPLFAECEEDPVYVTKLKIANLHSLGRVKKVWYDEAVKEYEKYRDELEKDPNFLIKMSQLFWEKGDYQASIRLGEKLLDGFQIPNAWALLVKAYAGLYDAGNVVRTGLKCIEAFPQYAFAYEEMAKVYYQNGRLEELNILLERARENRVESPYLEDVVYYGEKEPDWSALNNRYKSFQKAYEERLNETGDLNYYETGYPVITRYLRMYPCPALLNRRGLFSMAAKDEESAMKDFSKILERDPADAFAQNNIGCLYKYKGEYERALAYFNRGVEYMYREDRPEPTPIHLGNLAHTYELLGEYEQAAGLYQQICDSFGAGTWKVRDLSANLARTGRLKEARKFINKHIEMRESLIRIPLQYRACMYAKDWKMAGKYTIKYADHILGARDKNTRARFSSMYHMRAWIWMLKKRGVKGLRRIKIACWLSKTPFSTGKEKLDCWITAIFFMTLPEEVIVKKQTKPSAFTRLVKKGERRGFDRRKEIDNCLEQIKKIKGELCENQILAGKEPDLIQTKEFFYKEKYVHFLEFMLALYGEGIFAGEAALEKMQESPRCRLCNHKSCMREFIARGLLLEEKGEQAEAEKLYEKLAQEQPYNAFAQVKLNNR